MEEDIEKPEKFKKAIEQLFEKITNESEILENKHEDAEAFKERLNELWKTPLQLLELYLLLTIEKEVQFNKENHQNASEQNDYVFEALIRLHAKACLIGNEILTLMKNGYASGAFARWRSLHETAVTGLFISKHGNKVAERYLDYDYIESYNLIEDYLKNNDLYKKHSDILGYVPYDTTEDMIRIAKKRKELRSKYGDRYEKSHGWAAKVLEAKDCNFEGIERDVGLDYLRPFYNMANHPVHAGPKGNYHNLGLMDSDEGKILLVGQSNAGLADPGSNMVVSLQYINKALLTSRPNVENNAFLYVMGLLLKEINKELLNVDTLLKEKYRRKDTNTIS
ncbi:MAG: DUF5677 domain-containing protein [Methanobacterium sp.]